MEIERLQIFTLQSLLNDMQDAPGPSHPFARNGRPIIIGHRGAAGHLPENTMPSFQQAADWGVDGLELDIQDRKSVV